MDMCECGSIENVICHAKIDFTSTQVIPFMSLMLHDFVTTRISFG